MPRLSARQRELLILLNAFGGRAANLDFQKWLFLYCHEHSEGQRLYDFVPYRFGAFSFTSYSDRRKLIERGFLADEEKVWLITDDGRDVVGDNHDLSASSFAARFRDLRGEALVAESYRRAPFYATRSEIADRVLKGDAAVLSRINAAKPRTGDQALATIGYEGRSLEVYLNELLRAGVTLLCDVRRNPISRKYGFSKRTLARSAESLGIRYEHLPQLGISSEKRRQVETTADLEALFRDYERSSLPQQGEALDTIRRWIAKGERVALTCYERLPEHCHRHCVAGALELTRDKQIVTAHL
ncbi:MAG: DUF488 domain-containing protein [Acidobacteria bacterium]|nr:MAG: DUF488 domain-containing protein [Acidobacteriota bacterium]REK09684.1 MAG: DUF488 domain-containing protein [Acidobacteriota bacterium]